MKLRIASALLAVAVAAMVPVAALAQTPFKEPAKPATATTAPATTAPAPQPMTMKEVKQKLGIIVYPAKGQTPEQQESDEYGCLQWSADRTRHQAGHRAG